MERKMSPEKRQSGNNPPFFTKPISDMTGARNPPNVPTSYQAMRLESLTHRAPALPSIVPVPPSRTQSNIDGRRLPPMQLPAVRDSPSQTSTRALSIADLLSCGPESPGERNPQHGTPSHTQGWPSQVQPHISRSYPPHDTLSQMLARPLVSPQYPDRQPIAFRAPALQWQSQTHPTPHWRHPSASLERDYLHRSPTSSTYSFNREYCSSSSEPSPAASVPPAFPTPARQRFSTPSPYEYSLSIRQQPVAARACGFGERDRRVIDPPPILEMRITDRVSGAPEQDLGVMLALHCTLVSEDGKDDETEVSPSHDNMHSTRRLMGTLVASPYQAKDEHGVAGTFFVFPDLSCRSPGKYRLRFKLLRVDPTMMMPGAVHRSVGSILTDIFAVYTAKDFPGMRASSALLKALRQQGLNVGVKKGSDLRKGRGKGKKTGSSDEEEDYSESDMNEDCRTSQGSSSTASATEASPKTKKTKENKKVQKRKKVS